jgi:6-pyruvoyltetrahydropterin/6-carboxytetrahydropterin synthase
LHAGFGKLYVIPEIPTAEVLAKHWFYRLKDRVADRSDGHARLTAVKVWETPNCWAVYREHSQWPVREVAPEGR